LSRRHRYAKLRSPEDLKPASCEVTTAKLHTKILRFWSLSQEDLMIIVYIYRGDFKISSQRILVLGFLVWSLAVRHRVSYGHPPGSGLRLDQDFLSRGETPNKHRRLQWKCHGHWYGSDGFDLRSAIRRCFDSILLETSTPDTFWPHQMTLLEEVCKSFCKHFICLSSQTFNVTFQDMKVETSTYLNIPIVVLMS
jgi:hypothetical protein